MVIDYSEKRAWPHVTNANPCHGSTKQTSQQSAAADDEAGAGADDVGRIVGPAVWSSTSLLLSSLAARHLCQLQHSGSPRAETAYDYMHQWLK